MTDESVSVVPEVDQSSTVAQAKPDQNANDDHNQDMLPKTEVNNLVAAQKKRAYEKGLADARAQSTVSRETSNNTGLDESRIDELLGKKLESMREQEKLRARQESDNAKATVICNKLNASAVKFIEHTPEYRKAMDSVKNFEGAEPILEAASELDNPAEVLYYLARNKDKIPNLNAVCHAYNSTGGGVEELKKISDRLKENKDAVNSQSSAKPISHIKTNVRSGIGDNSLALDNLQDMKASRMFKV